MTPRRFSLQALGLTIRHSVERRVERSRCAGRFAHGRWRGIGCSRVDGPMHPEHTLRAYDKDVIQVHIHPHLNLRFRLGRPNAHGRAHPPPGQPRRQWRPGRSDSTAPANSLGAHTGRTNRSYRRLEAHSQDLSVAPVPAIFWRLAEELRQRNSLFVFTTPRLFPCPQFHCRNPPKPRGVRTAGVRRSCAWDTSIPAGASMP